MQSGSRIGVALAFLVGLALLSATPAQAGFSSNLVPVSAPADSGNTTLSSVAIAPNGDALVAWSEGGISPLVAKVRRVRADGTLGPELTVSDTTKRGQSPVVAFGPDGRAIVTWLEDTTFGQPHFAMARWIAPDDTLGPPVQVRSGSAASDPVQLAAAVNDDGSAIIAWHNQTSTPGPFRKVEARRVDANSTVGGLILPASAAGSQNAQVVPTGGATALLVWSETGGVVAVPVNAADALGTQQVPAPGSIAFPATAFDRAGHIGLVYRKMDGGTQSVQFRSLTAAGIGGSEQVLQAAGVNITNPDIDMNAGGRSLVSWSERPTPTTGVVAARYVGASGTPEPTTFTTPVAADAGLTAAGIGGSGDGALAWAQSVGGEPTEDFGRTISGGVISDGTKLSGASLGAGIPQVEMADNDVGVAAWSEVVSDSPSQKKQIFVRQILPPPTCSDATGEVVQGKPAEVALSCSGVQLGEPRIVSPPAHGTLSEPQGGRVTYTPEPRFKGTDSFTFGGTNPGGSGATHTATITVGKDTVKPKIKRFKISPTEISGKGKAAFALRYSEAAKAKIKIERRTGCSGKGCKRFAKVGTRKAKGFKVEDKLALKLKLDSGTYRATATATDPAGNRSKRKRLSFSVR